MYYQITHPPTADDAKQADELGRLRTHSATLTVQFVTVAGSYKPTRARLTLLTVPDRVAEQAARVLALLAGVEEAVKPSAVLRQRPEWTQQRVLLPTAPDAPPLDGTLLDGWDSACLTVVYRPGRVLARLAYCADDAARVDRLQIDGWQVTRPNPFQKLALGSGRPWNGVPSFAPVPGSVAVPRAASIERDTPALPDAPAPIQEEISQALTDAADGFLLGVTLEGSPVRLARRAMTVAVNGPQGARQRAVLALLRRGMQAGMGLLVMVDRALLPSDALHAWEARARLLDVQNITDSSAIPWRDSAPDLLAQALGGPSAALPALPARFGALLDMLDAEALRVPAVLGLVTMPGDDLRGVLAAGGMVVVPQDGDTASQVVARILMAYLATPPAIGRGLLVVSDPALVLPDALRQQAIQVVMGERSDALLRLSATDAGWTVAAPDGSPVADLLPDLMAQPTEGAGDMVDSIVREIGMEDAPAMAAIAPMGEPMDEPGGWWAGGARADDLEQDADPADAEPSVGVPMVEIADAPVEVVTDEFPAAAVVADVSDAMDVEATIAPAPALIDEEPASDLDRALGSLLTMLMADEPADATEAAIQAAVAGEDFGAADAAALAWAADMPQRARPWMWRVVLAEEDTERAAAAWQAIQREPDGAHVAPARAVLAALDAAAPAAWLVGIDAAAPGAPRDEAEAQAETGGEHAAPVRVGERAEPAVAVEPAAAVAPTVQEATPPALAPAPVDAAADLSDDAIRAIWQTGESAPQLVARLVASGVAAPAARARVRAIVSARPVATVAEVSAGPVPPIRGSTLPSMRVPAPPIPVEPGLSSAIPAITMTPLRSEPVAPAAMIPTVPADSMNGSSTPHMDAEGMDDECIWQRWQDGMKTDDLVLAICGKRGGPKADAARDRLYGVVIPRIVTALDCDDLLDRLAAGEPVASDPRYPDLMQRLARSEHAPAGNLERALLKRLARARQEV